MPKKKDMIQLSTLPVFEYRGQIVTDSRSVAQMIGRQHAHVMRTIGTMYNLTNPILDWLTSSFRQRTPTRKVNAAPATT